MTKTIIAATQKGGTGKTTILRALAVALSREGSAVALIDLDPQANAAKWANARPDDLDGPTVVSLQVGQLPEQVEAFKKAGADYVLIDTAGRAREEATAAMELADLVLVPTDLQADEVLTLSATKRMLRLSGDPAAFVILTRFHPNASNPVKAAEEMGITAAEIPIAPVTIAYRSIHKDAPSHGLTPLDTEPDGKAAAEILALRDFVKQSISGKVEKSTKVGRA